MQFLFEQLAKKSLHRPGIEPGPPAWQASILPLNQRCYTWKLIETPNTSKFWKCQSLCLNKKLSQLVGFEPTLPEGNWFLVSRLNHSATTATYLNCQILASIWKLVEKKNFRVQFYQFRMIFSNISDFIWDNPSSGFDRLIQKNILEIIIVA